MPLDNLRWGTLVAALVTGPGLWSLVSAGDLDSRTALVRGAAVVVGCTLGVAGLRRIVADFEAQAQVPALADEEVSATMSGSSVVEDTPAVDLSSHRETKPAP